MAECRTRFEVIGTISAKWLCRRQRRTGAAAFRTRCRALGAVRADRSCQGSRRSDVRRARVVWLTAGVTFACGAPATADDTEIFVDPGAMRRVRPNILLVIDTSGDMNTALPGGRAMYDPARTYAGACAADRIYWREGPGGPPSCESSQGLPRAANRCLAAANELAAWGLWTGVVAQWKRSATGSVGAWSALDAANGDSPLECEADAGKHGADAASPRRWAADGDDRERWTDDPERSIDWSTRSVVTLYDANWLNWYHHSPADDETVTRLDVAKSIAVTLVGSLGHANVGLMRFSNVRSGASGEITAEGGMVIHELADAETARESLIGQIRALTASGGRPLSETLYEASQYLVGREVHYGAASSTDGWTPFPSVLQARDPSDPGRYRSPIEFRCQRNYVVLLTGGEPSQDNGADEVIATLPGFESLIGSCGGTGPGRCLDELAKYLRHADLADLPGRQAAQTLIVGLGPEAQSSVLLADAARAGGGEVIPADDLDGVLDALQRMFNDVPQPPATFATPVVPIDVFNRARSLDELYLPVFRPGGTLRWPGNLKKYRIRNGRIVDVAGRDVIDRGTGLFSPEARDLWSPVHDGDRVEEGGAASRLPEPAQRRIFTHLGTDPDLFAASNAFTVENTQLTDDLLGTGVGRPTREDVILWARGIDVKDEDADGDRTEARRGMGDPLHARPAVAVYGGTPASPDARDAVVFVPTNDGFLHAVEGQTGRELWAFIPRELLPRLRELYRNPVVARRTHGLDGDLRVLRFDADGDGVVQHSQGDRVWIYFGMRRGGRHYYGLDVTDVDRPRMLWTLGPEQLDGVGETWSTPSIARVRVGSGAGQNGEHLVLIFGGGYDTAQDGPAFTEDGSGNRIFMVDARSGELLWYAGGPGASRRPDLELEHMRHSIPAPVTVLDTDGDHYADRMYAADMGGRIWRFDIHNGSSRDALVTGGVLADLGAASESPPTIGNTRRFYSAPDVALIHRRGADPYFNIAIGSGYRAHPLHMGTADRFYSIRDRQPFARLSQAAYAAAEPVRDGDLKSVSSGQVTPDDAGWKLVFTDRPGRTGEKVLAEAVTVNGVILFPTYQPVRTESPDPCRPADGINRVYALATDSGRPAVDLDGDGRITDEDASVELSQPGIAGEVGIVLEAAIDAPGDGGGTEQGRDALGRRVSCLAGAEVLGQCVFPGGVVRTYWRRTDIE